VEIQPDAVLVAGAGTSGSWETEFLVANLEDRPVTVFVGVSSSPQSVCPGSCFAQGFISLPANGSGGLSSRNIFVGSVFTFFARALEDGILPSAKARIANRATPSQSADLPTIRLSTLTTLNPRSLSFPGIAKTGPAHSNLVISEVSNEGMSVSVELFAGEGVVVATANYDIGPSGTLFLTDIVSRLGISDLASGQLRVTRTTDQGLLWGYVATVNADGAVSVFSGLNP
jgi:hypothetical protein